MKKLNMENQGKNKFINPSFVDQANLCLKSLFKLMDQEEYWFCERVLAVKAGNWVRADFIEKTYLIPLNKKIKLLAERMSRI